MRILLDTHVLLWFVLGDSNLSNPAKSQIEDPAREKLISPATYWEIAIKISIGKYSLSMPYVDFLQKAIIDNGFHVLPISRNHTAILTTLPFHHRDPFDRLIIPQAMHEQIPIISGDRDFDAYAVTRVW